MNAAFVVLSSFSDLKRKKTDHIKGIFTTHQTKFKKFQENVKTFPYTFYCKTKQIIILKFVVTV